MNYRELFYYTKEKGAIIFMCKLTIFTPTYNRLHLLERLYHSLLSQTNKNFEWIVVDDGSDDGTYEYVNNLKELGLIKIQISKQKNLGKHVAINKGVSRAKGDYFFIVDSDDYLPSNAVEKIIDLFDQIPNHEKFAGISGIRVTPENILVGKTFDKNYIDCTALERNKYGIEGDKAEVYYTNILKKYPFPIFKNENFLTESVVWYRIANDGYKIRWTNEPFYICDYQIGGLSNTTGKCSRCFCGYALTTKEFLQYKQLPYTQRFKQLLAYSSIVVKEHKNILDCSNYIGYPWWIVFILGIFGFLGFKIRGIINGSLQ